MSDINNGKNRIGLMGGTFDPVHYGHTGLAIAASRELRLDRVIMIPAFIQPFKKDKYVTSDEHRLAMLEIAVSEVNTYLNQDSNSNDVLEISTWEIEKGGISYTYDTIIHFKEVYSDSELWFIMGGDSLMKLENWYKGKDLLKVCNFAVGTRPMDDNSALDSTIEKLSKSYGTEIYKVMKPMLNINSTMVRDKLDKNEPISGLISPQVESYIYEYKLYGEESTGFEQV